MNKRRVIQKTADMVKQTLEGEGSGHDWWHIYRVWQLAKTIAKKEDGDMLIVELGALLHDIADYKLHDGNEKIGGETARKWLEGLDLNENVVDKVVHIVDNVSFKGSNHDNKINSQEGKIVQDADRLDAIGALGIARCFAYGGHKNKIMYDPNNKPHLNMTKEEYIANDGSSINHFYEKLLLLKDLMNTKTGREMAEHRHIFMENYLDEFYAEWDGKR